MAQINIYTTDIDSDNAGGIMEILKENSFERVEKFESNKINNKIYVKCIACQKQGYRFEDYSKYKKVGLIDFWNIHPYTISITNKLTGKVKLERVDERCYLGQGRLLDDMIQDSRTMEKRHKRRNIEGEKAKARTPEDIAERKKRILVRAHPLIVPCGRCGKDGKLTYANRRKGTYLVYHAKNDRCQRLSTNEYEVSLKGLEERLGKPVPRTLTIEQIRELKYEKLS